MTSNWNREWSPYEKVDAITNELQNVLQRAIEFDVPVETIIGILETLKMDYYIDHNIDFQGDIEVDET